MSNVESVMENIDAKLDENHNNTAEDNVQSDQSTEAQCHDITAILGTQSNESPDLDGNSSFEVLFNSGFDTTENTNLTGNTPEDQLTVIKRLSQIKEYKKQVLMTMNQLKGEGPEVDKDILRKLIDSYDNFKRQEEQYLEVLQNILVSKQKLALTVLDENSTDNKYADQPNASGTSSNQDSPLINPQILQTMINQQEDLRALHGHIVASQNNQHQDVERSSNSKSEQDLLTAQKSVENQAASLAAKRKLLEDLKARLSLYSDLSNKTTLEADLVENELGQRNTMDSKLQVLGEKKRLMDQILSVLNEPAVEQNGTHALDAFKVVEDPGSEPIGEKPQNVKSVLEKKYNELLATKKRIAEIRSMMTTLEANCGDISNETDEIPGPSRSAKINNMLQQASKNLPEQRFDPLEERKNLSQLKRQLLALDDDQLGKITDGNVLAGCQMPSNDLEEIEETHFPNGRQMNSIKNNLTDFLPCRISKPVRVQQNVKVAPKQQNIEVEDATECDDCEEDDDEEEENSLNVNQQKSDKNRASIRNNVIHSPLNNRRRIIENSRNEHISRRMNSNNVWNGVAQHQTNVENLQGPLSSSSDSRYDQLSQHIESIRLIFDSLINNQQQHQPQQQQAHQFMASSFPPPARQKNCGANENFMSQSLISMGVATNAIPQMQYQQQNQELMLSLIKCQQQLFAEHCELQRLNEMYKELSNKVNNENSLGQNAIDSRPLSTSSLYNLLAPNPYLHDSYKQQQSILTQRLPFYPRSTNQSFNSRQSRNEENSFPKRSSSTKLRRSSYLNERSNQSSFLNGRNAALKNRVFSPAVGHHSNNDARINDNSRNNLDFEDGPFDSLRESIYSEVATLISQNEQRPHYLLELFKELQLLSSDQLRERAFSAIHDILDRYLMDENDNSTGGIWNRANGPQSNVKISKSKSLKVKSIADSEKTYADERDRDATDNVSTEPEIVDNLNDISPDLNLENDEITFCPEMETRLSKIEHELSLFLSQASTTNIKCDEKFQEFLRKFALALLVSYNFLPSRDPTTKFFRKKLSESLQECLARFVNVKLSDYRQEILTSLIDTMKNQLSFYFLVQNVDSALDDSIKEKIENRKNERPDIKRIFLADPKIIPKQAPSKANFVEHNVRSPSEFSEILQYREEFQTVDDALAYIDDEFKALDNEEQASIRSRVESRNSAEVEKCIATTSKN